MIRVHTTPALLRAVGMIFCLAGLLVVVLLVIGLANGNMHPGSDHWIVSGIGLVFIFCGWAVFADDYLEFDRWSREVVFYERLFRGKQVGHARLTESSRLMTEDDPENPRCYRLMLDEHVVQERLSKRQAERLKNRIETYLGLG